MRDIKTRTKVREEGAGLRGDGINSSNLFAMISLRSYLPTTKQMLLKVPYPV